MGAKIPWDLVDPLIGTVPLSELARRFGGSKQAYSLHCQKLGVVLPKQGQQLEGAEERIDFAQHSDGDIAKMFGVDRATVRKYRHRKKLPAYDNVGVRPYDRLLGTMTDGELAEQASVSIDTIWRRRVRLGVPAFTKHKEAP